MASNASTTPLCTEWIHLPDIISRCPFPLRQNPQYMLASTESKLWLLAQCKLSKEKRETFRGLKGGLLAAISYPLAGYDQLRVCCDWVNLLFHLDDICDEMDDEAAVGTATEIIGVLRESQPTSTVGRLTQSFWDRVSSAAPSGAQRRFIEGLELFFSAVVQQAKHRQSRDIPDLESYIAMRRDTSGCKPCFALIEYANNLDIPDMIFEDVVVRGLEEAANDLITWSNDIYSYNVEQANGDTHNMVAVIQARESLSPQQAIDHIGTLCVQCIDRFQTLRQEQLPSWGPHIDAQLRLYIDGLGDWMIGNLVWSFETERYFGHAAPKVRATLAVPILPVRKEDGPTEAIA
ncbi:terpenoid synthase [Cubamyces sp. BRFM 1775]|nr:terpenoid synthase [Cubamyces sp. BRFM 1775]